LLFGAGGVSGGGSSSSPLSGRDSSATGFSSSMPNGIDKTGGATTTQSPAPSNAEGVSVSGSAPGIGNLSITADETNNALAILASPQQYGVIETALRKLDAAPLQVLLEAAIAEVTLTNDIKYGVQYFWKDSHNQAVLSDTGSTSVVPSLPGFAYMFSNGNNINVVLSALEQVTHVEVVSSPELMVLNNQTATLQVGDRVPIITEQAVSTQTENAPIV